MSQIEDDLLSALKELLEASSDMTNGQLPSAEMLERYQRARIWAARVVTLSERSGTRQ